MQVDIQTEQLKYKCVILHVKKRPTAKRFLVQFKAKSVHFSLEQ